MSKIELIQSSCLDQEVDAIVNAANNYMLHGGGIARAILLKAGEELNKACQEHELPIRTGEVIVTKAFNIKNAKIIIHAVGPNFSINKEAFKELFNAYYNSLESLKNNKYHSIAFPLISSGIFKGELENPIEVTIKECLKAYNTFINNYTNYEIDVKICAYTKEEYIKAKKIINKQ